MRKYEIDGLIFFSNVYHRITVDNINRKLTKLAPFIIIALLGFVMWWSQMIIATASVPMSITTNVYHVK